MQTLRVIFCNFIKFRTLFDAAAVNFAISIFLKILSAIQSVYWRECNSLIRVKAKSSRKGRCPITYERACMFFLSNYCKIILFLLFWVCFVSFFKNCLEIENACDIAFHIILSFIVLTRGYHCQYLLVSDVASSMIGWVSIFISSIRALPS